MTPLLKMSYKMLQDKFDKNKEMSSEDFKATVTKIFSDTIKAQLAEPVKVSSTTTVQQSTGENIKGYSLFSIFQGKKPKADKPPKAKNSKQQGRGSGPNIEPSGNSSV